MLQRAGVALCVHEVRGCPPRHGTHPSPRISGFPSPRAVLYLYSRSSPPSSTAALQTLPNQQHGLSTTVSSAALESHTCLIVGLYPAWTGGKFEPMPKPVRPPSVPCRQTVLGNAREVLLAHIIFMGWDTWHQQADLDRKEMKTEAAFPNEQGMVWEAGDLYSGCILRSAADQWGRQNLLTLKSQSIFTFFYVLKDF